MELVYRTFESSIEWILWLSNTLYRAVYLFFWESDVFWSMLFSGIDFQYYNFVTGEVVTIGSWSPIVSIFSWGIAIVVVVWVWRWIKAIVLG